MKFNGLTISFLLLALNSAHANESTAIENIGERLFLETRFAQAYYANPNMADPVMDSTVTANGKLKGPYFGKTINCRACHMVDEHKDSASAGMRSYADYAIRPPVPQRKDSTTTSTRNSMSMVNISIPHHSQKNAIFHFDGEFNSMEDLVRGTFTGRNFGWLVGEEKIAIKHIAKIIREDNGQGELAKEFGGAYSKIFSGIDKAISNDFKLPQLFRIDVDKASDEEIFNTIAKLISAYVSSLSFQLDKEGNYKGSPYDAFLMINKLPRKPNNNETENEYSSRLLSEINLIDKPRFIHSSTKKFVSHNQKFVFSKKELQGMKLFFRKATSDSSGGNCASCHTAPHFSDFGFHNTGLSQQNYDDIHGKGKFIKLNIPELKERNKNHNLFLPATAKHPNANSRFRSIPKKNNVDYADLGLWNIFANPDMPAPQSKLQKIICSQSKTNKSCELSTLTKDTIAAFKTPVLRDLGHSGPYMHSGQFSDLEKAVEFYINSSSLAKNNKLVNAASNIKEINITKDDVASIVAFLKSLNEDYE